MFIPNERWCQPCGHQQRHHRPDAISGCAGTPKMMDRRDAAARSQSELPTSARERGEPAPLA